MLYTPYPWQATAIDHAVEFLLGAGPGDKQMYAAPTGCGKSIVELHVQDRLPDAWIVSPREEIINGLLDKLGDPDGDMLEHCICTPIRMRNLLLKGELHPHPKYLIWDEGHHHSAESWQQVSLLSGLCPSIAYTATPYRGSPRSTAKLRQEWGECLWLITFKEAVESGYISMPKFSVLPLVDDDVVEVRNGEFAVESLDAVTVDRLGDLANHCMRWYSGGRWDRATIFAMPSSLSCQRFQMELAKLGIPSAVVSASTPRPQRGPIFRATEAGVLALLHIDIVSEGCDLRLRRLVDMAPTMSPVRWVQQLGRVTRPTEPPPEYVCIAEGTPILTDHGWVPIQDVLITDQVWDGVEYVNHDGVICNGMRETIDVHGVRMTPDHEVLTEEGWMEGWRVAGNINLRTYSESGQLYVMSTPPITSADMPADTNDGCVVGTLGRNCTAQDVTIQGAVSSGNGTNGFRTSCRTENTDCGYVTSVQSFDGAKSREITDEERLSCTLPGLQTRIPCSSTSQPFQGGRTRTNPSTALTMSTTTTGLGRSASLHESNSRGIRGSAPILPMQSSTWLKRDSADAYSGSPTEEFQFTASQNSTESPKELRVVYDLLNCGPRHRFQAGQLIVSNCCCRNIMRHAYTLEGCVPVASMVEAERAFPATERSSIQRTLGLEAVGRFKPTSIKLMSGLTLHMYCLSTVAVTGVVVEYVALVHPTQEPIWACKVNTIVEDKRTYGVWRACDAPNDVTGFSSVGQHDLSDKQRAWWDKCAHRVGLDPTQKVDRKNFQSLPVLTDLGVRFQ